MKLTEEQLAARRARLPAIIYPEELPVSSRREEISRALKANQVIIVSGETGSGKTTQLPKICLEAGRGINGLIGHTQPRRIAARATAARIAQELKSELGQAVGYKIRFTEKVSRDAYIKLMTDGILLAETQGDPLLRAYDTIIIDEAHERSLNIDFLLGYLRQLLPRRPDLKVIITSATIDAQRFAQHFASAKGPAPVIEVSGRLYPVEVRYRPVRHPDLDEDEERDIEDAIVDAVDECARAGQGDILIFLPGEREIRDTADLLNRHAARGHGKAGSQLEILPLYARLTAAEQEKVFRISTNLRRVVLATNVAETSLTVPGIRFVIDTGLARVKRYSYRNKIEQLQIEKIAQAAANQRAGRCGRVSAGICIRLYDEADYLARPRFTDPEILRSSLASVILRMSALHLGGVEDFPFIEPPPPKAISDGYDLLIELGALDEERKLTRTGEELARLPLDPRIGRMILGGRDRHALTEMLVIAAALSTQDPRDRPLDKQEAADRAHAKFAAEKSEFLGFLKLWKYAEELRDSQTNRQFAHACRENFISPLRLREWRDVHSQLVQLADEQKWRANTTPATYEQIHRALLTGLLGNIGLKSDAEAHYIGARGIKFFVHPGSTLGKKAGKWIMAAELIETTRLYARSIANIEPQWIEDAGAHLLKRSQYDPRWEKRAANAVAFERASLYGLLIYSQRRIDYALVNPKHARELLIRGGLVEGEYETRAPFFAHNRKLVREIEELEHKSRRPDVLVDDELIFAFYDALVPPEIVNGAGFEHWREQAEKGNPKLLYLKRDDLMRHEAAGITTELFPKQLRLSAGPLEFALTYHFEPGSPRDGVTAAVPVAALNQVNAARCEWLVPGMLKEKALALLKSLPQKLRRGCVPLPEFAQNFAHEAQAGDTPLTTALARYIRDKTTVAVPLESFKLETLPQHLIMNFKVVDEHGRQIDMGRNLAQLRAEHGPRAVQSFSNTADAKLQEANGRVLFADRTTWDFGDLEEIVEVGGLIGYPALADHTTHVNVELFDEPEQAQAAHRAGLARLFRLQLADQIRFLEKAVNARAISLLFAPFGGEKELTEQLISAGIARACLADPLPRKQMEFMARKEEGRGRLSLITQEIGALTGRILEEHNAVLKKLAGAKTFTQAKEDIEAQLQRLLPKNFITAMPHAQLTHYPRYLKAVTSRIDKLRADPVRDTRLMAEMTPLLQNWQRANIAQARQGAAGRDARLEEFRWLLEELRVSLYAQELRTPMPVSVKRLSKVWEAYRNL
ncbi:MAG TPA: ATP-dependent RNA helicase HrpA [Burkholderiales bacterium]|nr:ATP-dependent RNA helicase HrpA [Burkholderiales bacterium]